MVSRSVYDEMCMCFKNTIRLLVNYHNLTHSLSMQPSSMNKDVLVNLEYSELLQ